MAAVWQIAKSLLKCLIYIAFVKFRVTMANYTKKGRLRLAIGNGIEADF